MLSLVRVEIPGCLRTWSAYCCKGVGTWSSRCSIHRYRRHHCEGVGGTAFCFVDDLSSLGCIIGWWRFHFFTELSNELICSGESDLQIIVGSSSGSSICCCGGVDIIIASASLLLVTGSISSISRSKQVQSCNLCRCSLQQFSRVPFPFKKRFCQIRPEQIWRWHPCWESKVFEYFFTSSYTNEEWWRKWSLNWSERMKVWTHTSRLYSTSSLQITTSDEEYSDAESGSIFRDRSVSANRSRAGSTLMWFIIC